ncbi:hypothetical protein BRUR0010001c01_00034 [Bifidobacterium phage BlindUri1]|nr:hypothetical protein BRUR0010001c01_00034 [Bifidobacterium phage BlindUri1]
MSYPFNMTISLNKLTIEPKGKYDEPKIIDLTPYIGNIAESVNLDLVQPKLNKQEGHYTIDDCKPTVEVRFAVDTIIGNLSWQNDADMDAIWGLNKARNTVTAVLANGLTIVRPKPVGVAADAINLNRYVERTETSIDTHINRVETQSGTMEIPEEHMFTVTAQFKPKQLTVGTVEPYTYNQ